MCDVVMNEKIFEGGTTTVRTLEQVESLKLWLGQIHG